MECTNISRLAGNVSKSGQKGEINLRDLDIDEEIAKADNELLGKPLTRRQARVVSRAISPNKCSDNTNPRSTRNNINHRMKSKSWLEEPTWRIRMAIQSKQ